MNIKKVSIIGLGKLGLPMACCFANKGFYTLGIDTNTSTIELINRGEILAYEPHLKEMLHRVVNKKLNVTLDIERAIEETDATFFIVPTPSDSNGSFDTKYLEEAIRKISIEFKKSKKKYHLFVINSTVMPGSIESKLIPIIEKTSKKKLNKDFGVCYNPEFIAIGSVIKDFLNPDVLLIGESNEYAGKILLNFFQKILDTKCHMARMSIVSAEITKISLNAYITTKISFANQLMSICSSVTGADIDQITAALGKDRRIGSNYLRGGISYGGPCFPRDNRAFQVFARQFGVEAFISSATDKINENQHKNLFNLVKKYIQSKKPVLIVGAAYKNDTGVIEESASIRLLDSLIKENVDITVYDPLAAENLQKRYGDKIKYASDLFLKNLDSYSTYILSSSYPKVEEAMENHDFKKPVIIIDCWRTANHLKSKKNVGYIPFGKSVGND